MNIKILLSKAEISENTKRQNVGKNLFIFEFIKTAFKKISNIIYLITQSSNLYIAIDVHS